MNTRLIASIFVLVAGLLIATSAHAQVAISEDGVTFPDDSAQYTGVPNDCPHSESIVWDTDTERWLCESDLAYAIGGEGPGGGIVFYVTEGGQHGLEAAPAPAVADPQAMWCPEPDNETDITGVYNIPQVYIPDGHSGAHNTPLIAAECGAASAAGIAAAYAWPKGQTDGFLPNKEELDLMYWNLYFLRVGGFAGDFYWSSSEFNDSTAWSQYFDGGILLTYYKHITLRVRAVRAF